MFAQVQQEEPKRIHKGRCWHREGREESGVWATSDRPGGRDSRKRWVGGGIVLGVKCLSSHRKARWIKATGRDKVVQNRSWIHPALPIHLKAKRKEENSPEGTKRGHDYVVRNGAPVLA